MARKLLLGILLFLMVLLTGTTFPETIAQNFFRVRTIRTWMSVKPIGVTFNDALQDGIPDGWLVDSWGGATRIYRLERRETFAGHHAVRIERTNTQGVAALVQDIVVPPSSQLVCTIYAKGTGGAIQFRFHTKGRKDWVAEGWQDIDPSEDWQQYRLSVSVPSDKNRARLRLRTEGLVWFDEAYVGVADDGRLGPNLLRNPGFEQDGMFEDPLEWWQNHVAGYGPLIVSEGDLLPGLSYLNMTDMLSGRYDAIRRRAQQLGESCASTPEMTTWLLARGNDFEQMGGPAARERLYQLAIDLAPNCPQPYAAMAEFYQYSASWHAAELYHQAAELAGRTAEAGNYYFLEGLLHMERTGNTDRAVAALQQAEQLSGWEQGHFGQGVASLYLGQVMEAEGHFAEAMAAYQRVIDCEECNRYHLVALTRLKALYARE